ncbi:MAG: type II toxin-antitoxin system VapC family toxin [Actinobacteria bacterium]|nr:type II toxin-antitoxin system VapC family toxin [Actinomycetota bacterium]
MILLDVNVLLAAHRADHPHHDLVSTWFVGLLAGDEPFTVPDIAWASFVRIATSRRIFEVPTPVPDAFAFLRSVRAHPLHAAVVPGGRHLELFEELCSEADAFGDLAADAYIAAIALEQGCSVASLDRDFARFPTVRWIRPPR